MFNDYRLTVADSLNMVKDVTKNHSLTFRYFLSSQGLCNQLVSEK